MNVNNSSYNFITTIDEAITSKKTLYKKILSDKFISAEKNKQKCGYSKVTFLDIARNINKWKKEHSNDTDFNPDKAITILETAQVNKENKLKIQCGFIRSIRNFLSKLQNIFLIGSFKTSLKYSADLLVDLRKYQKLTINPVVPPVTPDNPSEQITPGTSVVSTAETPKPTKIENPKPSENNSITTTEEPTAPPVTVSTPTEPKKDKEEALQPLSTATSAVQSEPEKNNSEITLSQTLTEPKPPATDPNLTPQPSQVETTATEQTSTLQPLQVETTATEPTKTTITDSEKPKQDSPSKSVKGEETQNNQPKVEIISKEELAEIRELYKQGKIEIKKGDVKKAFSIAENLINKKEYDKGINLLEKCARFYKNRAQIGDIDKELNIINLITSNYATIRPDAWTLLHAELYAADYLRRQYPAADPIHVGPILSENGKRILDIDQARTTTGLIMQQLRDYREEIDAEAVKDKLSKKIRLERDATYSEQGPTLNHLNLYPKEVSGAVNSFNFSTVTARGAEISGLGYIIEKSVMEDRHINTSIEISKEGSATKTATLFCVFDGHGGYECADFMEKNFANLLKEKLKDVDTNNDLQMWNLLKTIFVYARDEWKKTEAFKINSHPGSAAIACLIIDGKLWVASAGDCRAVLSSQKNGRLEQLSKDAKFENPNTISAQTRKLKKKEEDRFLESLHKRNGKAELVQGVLRVHTLNMPRSIEGNPDLMCVSARAGVTQTKICDNGILIIGCDGLWDKLSSMEAVLIAEGVARDKNTGKLDTIAIAASLRKEVIDKGGMDNLTITVVDLTQVPQV